MRIGTHKLRVAALGVALLATAACGSGSDDDDLTLGMLMAFSGPNVIEGQEAANGCLPAEQLINEAGGVLGRTVSCVQFDTRGTASEAVPAARQMISTAGDLLSVVGPSTAEAVAVVPVLDEASKTMFSVAGDGRFDRNESDYFFRLITSDSVGAQAMALYSQNRGYEDVALVFTSGASAQANVPPLEVATANLGISIGENLTLTAEQPSYRTEVTRLVASEPDAIVFEADAVTSGTFLTELNQAGGGDIPLITNTLASTGDWQEAALAAYGSSEALAAVLEPVIRFNETDGEGAALFSETLQEMDGENGIDFGVFGESVYARAHYDGAILAALAATQAESFDPADFNSLIPSLVEPGEGKTIVTNYADGVEAIEAGEDIQYVGANDEIALNEYQNVTGTFAYYVWNADTDSLELSGRLDADVLAELSVQD